METNNGIITTLDIYLKSSLERSIHIYFGMQQGNIENMRLSWIRESEYITVLTHLYF